MTVMDLVNIAKVHTGIRILFITSEAEKFLLVKRKLVRASLFSRMEVKVKILFQANLLPVLVVVLTV